MDDSKCCNWVAGRTQASRGPQVLCAAWLYHDWDSSSWWVMSWTQTHKNLKIWKILNMQFDGVFLGNEFSRITSAPSVFSPVLYRPHLEPPLRFTIICILSHQPRASHTFYSAVRLKRATLPHTAIKISTADCLGGCHSTFTQLPAAPSHLIYPLRDSPVENKILQKQIGSRWTNEGVKPSGEDQMNRTRQS